MARKQHHLEAAHDQAHKTRARELGSPETERARREALASKRLMPATGRSG